MSEADPEQLQVGPSQREVYRVLREDGGLLRSTEVAERADRVSKSAVIGALERLQSNGLVEVHDLDDPNGRFLYSALENDRGD